MAYSTEQINFINQLAPFVQAECIKRGYHVASPILAQASTESFKGQGLSQLATKYHNYFGMKTGSSWKGESVNLKTGEEYTPGVITTIKDNFRVYPDMEQGVKGYFDFINTKRYANLKTASSPEQYLQFIRADGYATSLSYVQTCMSRITGLNLKRFDNFSAILPTGNPYPEPTRNIKLNSRGNDVKWLQWMLNDKEHCGLIIDGIAGPKTISCLTEYQVHNNLKPDGICGPLTRASLKLSS